MRELRFIVRGRPIPEGSLRPVKGRGKAEGKIFLIADNALELKSWRGRIAEEATQARRDVGLASPLEAVSVELAFFYPRLRTDYGTKGNLLPSAPLHKVTRPDLDKLVRAVFDALKDSFVLRDDSVVVELIARKDFGEPCVLVVVRELPDRVGKIPAAGEISLGLELED